ncbi:hypothetical protein H4Q26_003398 [Puccinia striiformis f. sp. tritici PST-130]|nr:hypothetical protein H4Q26_003398 [Puccinia striiformis f. sp. tritici PST-130]
MLTNEVRLRVKTVVFTNTKTKCSSQSVFKDYIIFLAVIALTLLSHVQLSSPPGPQHCTQTFIDNDGNIKLIARTRTGIALNVPS